MASATLLLPSYFPSAARSSNSKTSQRAPAATQLPPTISSSSLLFHYKKNTRQGVVGLRIRRAAYISAPASDPDIVGVGEDGTKTEASEASPAAAPISGSVIWSLLLPHKLRLALALLSLCGCTTCTLSMPLLSGTFFEILVGTRSEPLWELLSKMTVLYILEPFFTVIFVINMTTIWEKVMASLRAQVYKRMLIQKVEFFDRYKVGELTGLLTSDLGSLKDVVSENISRDRGLRALTEASYHALLKSELDSGSSLTFS